MTNPNRPVYRHPPRSHAYSCKCPRCEPFKGRPLSSGAWIWVAIPVAAGFFWVLSAPLRIWHTVGRDGQMHPDTATYIAYGIPIGAIFLLMVFASIRSANRRPPKGRLRVEATTVSQLKPPPASVCVPPAVPFNRPCLHPNAVKVNSSVTPGLIWNCWCPDCDETELPANFRLPCCGCEPGDGTKPAVHVYNCRYRPPDLPNLTRVATVPS